MLARTCARDARDRARQHLCSAILTPTEAAAVSVVYGLHHRHVLLSHDFDWRDLPGIFVESARSTGAILFILSGALFVGMVATLAGIPDAIVNAIQAHRSLSPLGFLFLITAVLLVLGCFLDGFTLLTVVTPLLLPSVKALAIDPIHFAIVLTLNIEIAAITPPIGLNLFVIAGISGTTMKEVVAGSFPFVFALLAVVILLIFFPADPLVLAVKDAVVTEPIIDAHHHIWRRADQPWLQGPTVPRIFGAYDAIKRDYPVEEFLPICRHRRGQVGLCADQLGAGSRGRGSRMGPVGTPNGPAGRTPSSASSTCRRTNAAT